MTTVLEKLESQYGLVLVAIDKHGCKFIRNRSICGTGKTTTTCDVIVYRLASGINERWVIAMPNHDLCGEFATKYGGVHLWGKKWFCTHGNQWEMECSKECRKTCRYYTQEFNAPLIFCPYEMIGKCHDDLTIYSQTKLNLVIEEIPDRIICPTLQISPTMQFHYGEPITIKDHNRNWVYNQVIGVTKHEPQTLEDFRLYRFINHAENVISDGHTLYALNKLDTTRFKRVIFNCATTPESFQRLFMGRRVETIDIKERINNPFLYFRGKFTKVASKEWFPNVKTFVNKLRSDGKKVFFATKQAWCDNKIEDPHYGAARGINKFNQEWDLAVIYGEFHYPPQFKHALGILLGFDCSDMLQELERAEVEQTLHRVRPFIHPNTPIIVMSNRILQNGDKIELSNKDAIIHYNNGTTPTNWYGKMALNILKSFLGLEHEELKSDDLEEYYTREE